MGPVKSIDSERMRGNFSEHACDYDSYASVQKRVVALLRDRIPHNDLAGAILDIGTGTGGLAGSILKPDIEQQLVIMDIAHGMTCEAAGRLTKASACDGDARWLPFADSVFNTVMSSSVYQWVDCLPSAFTEVARTLKPGGLFAVALFGEETLHELRSSHKKAMAACGSSRSSHVQSFPSLAEVAAAVSAAGLRCEQSFSKMEVEYHQDVPDLMRQLKQIGASNASAERPRGLASRKVMQTMIRVYEENYRLGTGLPASYEVLMITARKPIEPNREK